VKQYRFYNNLLGWLVFAVAAITYILTSEATASLWDCSEFIATAFKLEVGHPPGAPLFVLMARVAGFFAGPNIALVARMVNYLSAFMSAFTILFLFWTITHIAKKLAVKDNEYSKTAMAIILGSGLVGALAYTFSGTFWFSAVEGEVYASSSFFTAIVFWAMLKWESVADDKYANRWIILIAYLMGLSIGVHLLNLLTIPAIVLVYYFRKFTFSWKGLVIALAISFTLLGIVMYGIIQGLIVVASWFELLFVNSFGMPFNSGVVFYALLIIALLVFGLYYSYKHNKAILNTAILAVAVVLIGYTSYAMIVIRSNAGTPLNENQPDNVFSLLSYLDREQYGDRPLFYGQYYNAPVEDYKETSPMYAPVNGHYEVVGHQYDVKYDSRFMTFFPRMYSSDPNHAEIYKDWADIKGTPVDVTDNGKNHTVFLPTFGENLKFFFKYQVGYMYMRYFLWNFAGRQNDMQGNGGILKGNWITGIRFVDERLIGNQEHIPPSYKNVPSRNVYYFLPLFLGIIGLLYVFDKSRRYFLITVLLFFMTGLAIVLYLNQTPLQPRERDYAYAGSFYAFAIWIGLGVLAITTYFKQKKGTFARAILITAGCLILVPGIMAKENWRDHDRSGRYTTRSFAYNYLNSCAPNAILFTFGDNDTFPLWYLQEVEGIRTDVRVVNTMLLSADWYIDQMKRKCYLSDTLPITFKSAKYLGDKLSRVYLIDRIQDSIPLSDAIDFVESDSPQTKTIEGYSERLDYIPGRKFYIPVNKKEVLRNGTVLEKDAKLIEKDVRFKLKGNGIDKSELITMDILAHNNWKRPVYFIASNMEGTLGLDDYFQLEGFAFRLVPIKTKFNGMLNCGRINTDLMYHNLMEKFDYGRMNAPDVYLDYFHLNTLQVMRFRNNFARLAEALIKENRRDSAIKVLDKCVSLASPPQVPDDLNTISIAKAYFAAGDSVKGLNITRVYSTTLINEMDYFMSLRPGLRMLIDWDIRYNFEGLRELDKLMIQYKQIYRNTIEDKMNEYEFTYKLKDSD
jgi:hypothetical protein